MTTIQIINAICTAIAAGGLGGLIVRGRRQPQRVQPLYLTLDGRRIRRPD
jgi:ABC-type proline/glycine betaine transport system permease subunit